MGVKELSDKVKKGIDKRKSGEVIEELRVTHLSEEEVRMLRKDYSNKKDFRYKELSVIDARKLNEKIYSVEIDYLGGDK